MLRAVLAPLKIVVFLIHMLASYLIFIVLLYPLKLFGVSKFRWKNKMVKGWAKRGLKLLGLELEVKGPVPEPPFFLVSNHLSYLDIPVYYSILNTTFVSKAEVRNWPVIGAMPRSLHVIFIDRQKRRDVMRVNREISAEIGDEQGVLMFQRRPHRQERVFCGSGPHCSIMQLVQKKRSPMRRFATVRGKGTIRHTCLSAGGVRICPS